MERAAEMPLGQTVLAAVRAARSVTRSNANLGIVLAIAPLAAVPDAPAAQATAAPATAAPAAAAAVLARLTPADAADVWQAIRLSQPGGLGRARSTTSPDQPPPTCWRQCGWQPHTTRSRGSGPMGISHSTPASWPTCSRPSTSASPCTTRSWMLFSRSWHGNLIRSSPASMVCPSPLRCLAMPPLPGCSPDDPCVRPLSAVAPATQSGHHGRPHGGALYILIRDGRLLSDAMALWSSSPLGGLPPTNDYENSFSP